MDDCSTFLILLSQFVMGRFSCTVETHNNYERRQQIIFNYDLATSVIISVLGEVLTISSTNGISQYYCTGTIIYVRTICIYT